MKHACLFAVAATVALLGIAAPANATHTVNGLGCGDIIETENATVTLTANVECGTNPDTDRFGVLLGANGITLNLNGFAIRGSGLDFSTGITDAVPLRRVAIRGGTIEGFSQGIAIRAIESRVTRMTISAQVNGIFVSGFLVDDPGDNRCEPNYAGNTCIISNDITITGPGAQVGIFFRDMNDGHIWGNTVRATVPLTSAIRTDAHTGGLGDRPRIVKNVVESCGGTTSDSGIFTGGITFAMVAQNKVQGCNVGIHAGGAFRVRRNEVIANTRGLQLGNTTQTSYPAWAIDNNASGNAEIGIYSEGLVRIEGNAANVNALGIYVAGGNPEANATLQGNTTNSNSDTGIYVGTPGVTVSSNTANLNTNFGINAVEGTLGGGNTASGNNTSGTGADCVPASLCTP